MHSTVMLHFNHEMYEHGGRPPSSITAGTIADRHDFRYNNGLLRLPRRLAHGMPRLLPCFHLRSLRERMLGSLPDGDPNGDRHMHRLSVKLLFRSWERVFTLRIWEGKSLEFR